MSKSLTFVATISIIAIIFSGANTYLYYSNSQSDQDLKQAIDEINNKIDSINTPQPAIGNQNSTVFENIILNITQLNEKLDSLQKQSPKDVFDAVHKEVVIIRTDLGQGSGFLIESQNTKYILTNWHVVENSSTIEVQFYDRTRSNANIIGTDAYSDIAVIQPTNIPTDVLSLHLGNSSNLFIGQQLVAIGNPLGMEGSLSSGFVSQLNTELTLQDVPIIVPVIQIDLTIAPGSSGGPLFDLDGNVVGLTNAGTDYGFNFAIPSNIANRVFQSIIEKGYYSHPLIGFNSITLAPEIIKSYNIINVDPFQTGMVVTSVIKGMPAETVGLIPADITYDAVGNIVQVNPKDIILAIDNHTIIERIDWNTYVSEHVSPNQPVTLTIMRSGEIIYLQVTPTIREQY